MSESKSSEPLPLSETPHRACHATKEELRSEGYRLTHDCPACAAYGTRCLVAAHPTAAYLGPGVPLTVESDGYATAAMAAASKFNSVHHMAHVALPVGPDAFYPRRSLIVDLLADVNSSVLTAEQQSALRVFEDRLQECRCAHTYVCPASAEDNFCRPNLDSFVREIVNLCEPNKIATLEAKAVAVGINMTVGKSTTSPEPVVVARFDHVRVGLVATESKALGDSLYKCMAQAIQMAADLALNLCDYMAPSEVVVPFILCSWEHFQFGCVYLFEKYYPCPVLLSGPLSITVNSDRRWIARWGAALAEHSKRLLSHLPQLGTGPRAKRQKTTHCGGQGDEQGGEEGIGKSSGRLICASNELLYKPIEKSLFPRARLARVMSVFHRLASCENPDCIAAVCFPEGVMGLPSQEYQQNLFEFVKQKWTAFFELKKTGGPPPADFETGHPIVVYRQLDLTWTSASHLRKQPDKTLCLQFINALKLALELFADAGVIHMDIRLPNVFYKKVDTTAIAVKVIDWDDALLLGDDIPRQMKLDFDGNLSFPMDQTQACRECHNHMITKMCEELGLF